MYTKYTSIRLHKETKGKLENLDFVRKHTHDQIVTLLIKFYQENNIKND